MKTGGEFACPNCGGMVKKNTAACPHCGSDDRTGWSDRTYLDGIDMGDDVDYDELVEQEFPSGKARGRLSWKLVVAAVLLLLSAIGIIRILF
jgi:hypothetical protein